MQGSSKSYIQVGMESNLTKEKLQKPQERKLVELWTQIEISKSKSADQF